MKKIRHTLAFFLILGTLVSFVFAFFGCGSGAGGVEAGNPSQLVTGSLEIGEIVPGETSDCEADRVTATDSAGDTVTAVVAEDCSFALLLPTPAAYRLDFFMAGDMLASMRFENSSKRFPSPAMILFPGNDTLFLDRIRLNDGIATPSREPSAQVDQDGDGVPDFFDEDDDADGITDEDENDCDLDGIVDDFDENISNCSPNAGASPPLEVSPRNSEGAGAHGSKVKTNEDIKIRFSCPIDVSSVGDLSLLIFPENDPSDVVACDFAITGSGKQLRCSHSDLMSDTVYDARLEGVRCDDDGSEVPAVSWSWKTR
jgi:hypothetical protein